MNQELELDLFKRHPWLLANRSDAPLVFECGDGWYQLLDDLFSELEEAYKNDESEKIVQVGYVKEKFGTLVVGMGFIKSQKISCIKEKYEKKSAEVCEGCGKTHRLRWIGLWATTKCDDCVENELMRLKERRKDR